MCFRIPTSRRSALIMVLSLSAAYLAFGAPAQAAAAVPTISIDEVALLVHTKGAHIFDANSAQQFASGHVPTAKHLPFDEVSRYRLPAKTDAKIVFYCWNETCSASHEAATKAADLGYTDVHVMRAGIKGWTQAGKRVETEADAS